MIRALDTHETVRRFTAADFTDAQTEALTAVVKRAVEHRLHSRDQIRHCRCASRDGGHEGRTRQMGRRGRFRASGNNLAGAEAFPCGHP